MGSQVAWQMAFHGKHVTVYDAIPAGLDKGKVFHKEYATLFLSERGATRQQIDDTLARLDLHHRPAGSGARCRPHQRIGT